MQSGCESGNPWAKYNVKQQTKGQEKSENNEREVSSKVNEEVKINQIESTFMDNLKQDPTKKIKVTKGENFNFILEVLFLLKNGHRFILWSFSKENRQELNIWLMRFYSLDLCETKIICNQFDKSLYVEIIPDKNELFY